MFTVLPLVTCALGAGFWASTFPGMAPPAQVISKVVLVTSPAPVMADWATLSDWPTTLGTVAQLPLEMTRLTDVLGGMSAPATGFCADTSPDENWLEHALDWLPTFRPAWLNVAPAEAGDCPSTLGTFTEVWVPDTVSTTGTVDLTLVPPAGFWLSTVPMGLWLVT